jgi:hypothetical protein
VSGHSILGVDFVKGYRGQGYSVSKVIVVRSHKH